MLFSEIGTANLNRAELRRRLDNSIPIRKIPKQNILYKLRDRETTACRPNSHIHLNKSFYLNIFPNFTVAGVEKPPCFLRKFSPNGRFFIAFSFEQTSLEIYEFQGSQAAEKLLEEITGDYMQSNPENLTTHIKTVMFNTFFRLLHTTNVATDGEGLNRECSLFTEDSKYVIVGSAIYVPEDPYPSYRDMYKNNESLSPYSKSPLEDYSLHVVQLETGMLCDTRRFKCDKIYLSHNQGIYMYKRTVAVLSVQHQTIHIFQLSDEGVLIEIKSIGRFCYEDDQYLISSLIPTTTPRGVPGRQQQSYEWGPREKVFCTLKQKLLVHLYRKAQESYNRKEAQARFYRNFEFFCKLRMWKMQLIDEDHVLIRYAMEDVITMKVTDPNSQPSFFAFFNIRDARFISFYDNTSTELLSIFENFYDSFKISGSLSNIYSRQMHQRFKQTIANARCGGQSEATKRILAQLPISAQSYSQSPYLDSYFFSFDDKWVSAMERPKTSGENAIRFYSRDSNLLKFKIYTGLAKPAAPVPPTARRLVAFTFHPSEPFAISVQRTHTDYVVNFHLRHQCCKDEPSNAASMCI